MSENPKLRADVLTRDVDDEILIYDPKNGEVFLLNATAAAIIELCDGHTPIPSIVQEIVKALAADPETVQKDVNKILLDMKQKGILEWSG